MTGGLESPEVAHLVDEYCKEHYDKKYVHSDRIAVELGLKQEYVTYYLTRAEKYRNWSSSENNRTFLNHYYQRNYE